MIRKVQLYVVSLWLLFILVAIKEFKLISWDFSFSIYDIENFFLINSISVICIALAFLGIFFYLRFSYVLKGSTQLPKQIKKIEDQNYEHLTFLTTYIIPFLRVNLKGMDLLMTILLLILIGAIFVKTNLFYKNPTLALLGYKLYKVDTENQQGLIFISKDNLSLGDNVHHIFLSDNVYFVKNE